VVDNLKTQE